MQTRSIVPDLVSPLKNCFGCCFLAFWFLVLFLFFGMIKQVTEQMSCPRVFACAHAHA